MFDRLMLLRLFFYIISLLNSFAGISAAQDACIYRSGAMLVNSVVVVKHTIHIINSVPYNTTLQVNTDLTITVDNAPTSLDFLTTYYSRSTAIETMNGSVPRSASRYGAGSFTLIVVASELSPKRRRQAGAFMSYTGRTTSSCTQASTLTLVNNQLLVTFSNGTVAQFSATTGATYTYFAPSTTPGDITTTFSLSNTGTLLWTNPNFFNGNALFCVLPSGVIVAVFQQGAQPISCVFIDLTIAELNSCVATSTGSAVLGGPGPSGPSGLQGSVGPSGAQGIQGSVGPSGPQGAQGAQGIQGIQGSVGPTGVQGIQGSVGPIGPSGGQGIQGSAGPSGPQGAQGIQGVQGNVGPTGAQGVQGIQGSVGPQGAQGIQGIQGNTGPTGSQGIQGIQGIQGSVGSTGAPGLPGSAGPTGAQGLQGVQGNAGPTGVQGIQGSVGLQGAQGIQGSQGHVGPTGAQGIQGSVGPTGAQGVQGSVGPTGSQGAQGSVGPSGPAGGQGIQGSVGTTGAQGIQGSVGPTGPQGAQGSVGPSGPAGVQGIQGSVGPTGAQGIQGSVGPTGPQGVQGSVGPSGPRGSAGPSGAQGIQGSGGPSGAQGLTGPSGAPGIAYAYLGCFYQMGASSTSTNKVLTNFIQTYTTSGNPQCSVVCNSQNFNFYGTVNVGTTSVDCYCGDTLNFVTILNLGTGPAPDNNCALCVNGPAPAGECGIESSSTVAIFARAF